MIAILNAALRYARLGLCVIPLAGKKPVLEDWPERATTDEVQIRKWFTEPGRNVGIACGRKSGIFVLDVDPRHGGEESLENLTNEQGALPETWQQITGAGGKHYLFRYPGFHIGNIAGLRPGLDIRGDGGQIVAAPSVHPDTGKAYDWDGMEPIERQPLADGPTWLLALIKTHGRDGHPGTPPTAKIPKGQQHYYLVRMAGTMRNKGAEFPEIFEALKTVNQNRCTEPGPEKNIRQIAESVCKYPPGKVTTDEPPPDLDPRIREPPVQAASAPTALDLESMMEDKSICVADLVIEGLIPKHGVVLVGGRPKEGKSWFACQLGLAFVTGQALGGWLQVKQPGRCHLWALEDQFALTKDKFSKLLGEDRPEAMRDLLILAELGQPVLRGGDAIIRTTLKQHPAELVIFDSLFKLTGQRQSHTDISQADYDVIDRLRKIALNHCCCVVVIMHTKKGARGGDPVENLLGTSGNTAAADVVCELKRTGFNGKLTVVGRMVPREDYELMWHQTDRWGWTIEGQGDDASIGETSADVLAFLEGQGASKPGTVATGIHRSFSSVWNALLRLQARGCVVRDAARKWQLVKK